MDLSFTRVAIGCETAQVESTTSQLTAALPVPTEPNFIGSMAKALSPSSSTNANPPVLVRNPWPTTAASSNQTCTSVDVLHMAQEGS